MAFSLATAAVTVAALVASVVPTVEAKDQVIDWSLNTPQGGTKLDILQCQEALFEWTDGLPHDIWEFPDEESSVSCDFSNAVQLAPRANTGSFSISEEDTIEVTKRWFGCSVGSHCGTDTGNMKIALKIRPLFTEKHPGFECSGGTVQVTKNEPTLKACRKRCKRRRGCIAIEYNSLTKQCSAYSEVPTKGVANADETCEIATTTCDDFIPTPAPVPECSLEVRVGCHLSSDKTTECNDIPTPDPPTGAACSVLVNYTYYVHHTGPPGAVIRGTTRTRMGASLGGDVRQYQEASIGFPSDEFLIDTWEEDIIDLCNPNTYTTTVKSETFLQSADLTCSESEEYVLIVDPVDPPPSPAPQCNLNVEVSCQDSLDGTECGSIAIPAGSPASACNREVTYTYRIHNVGSSTATILSVNRVRPNAVMHDEEYDFASEFPTPADLERLFAVTISELPIYNFCEANTYMTDFTVTATCDGGTTIEEFTDDYEFMVNL